jgi:predicted GIY-YIG superfamily endonuclease
LVYSEDFSTKKEALKREKELKSYQGRKFIKEKILCEIS